jgi:hypothetical protein
VGRPLTPRATPVRWVPLAAALLIAAVVRLVPAQVVYGADDVGGWHEVSDAFQTGADPYSTTKLNWPPLWPWVVHAEARLSSVSGLPFHFAVKLAPILADVAITGVLYVAALRLGRGQRAAFTFSLLYALNPVSIFTSAFHGQFDSIAALFALLAVLGAVWWPAGQSSGIWLGLGGLAKLWPVVLLPAILQSPDWRRRGYVTYLTVAPTFFSVLVGMYLVAETEIRENVIDYTSTPYWWGITSLRNWIDGGPWRWYADHGSLVLYAGIVVVTLFCLRRATPPQLALAIVLTFYLLTPGFGTQYLVWVVPLALLADTTWGLVYSAVAGVELLVEYVMRPWDGDHWGFVSLNARSARFVADVGQHHDIWMTDLLRLVIYAVVAAWLASLLVRIRGQEAWVPAPNRSTRVPPLMRGEQPVP